MERSIDWYVKVKRGAIPEELAKKARKELDEAAEWETHKFWNKVEQRYVSFDNELEVSNSEIDSYAALTQCVRDTIDWYHAELGFPWYSTWQAFSNIRFNRYAGGAKMKGHCDHIHTLFDGEQKGIPILSVVGHLNEDYEGGEFVMWDTDTIELKAGDILVFPSVFLYPHYVAPVTSGVRNSFVSWVW